MEDTLELGLHDLAFMLPLPLPNGTVPDMPPDDFPPKFPPVGNQVPRYISKGILERFLCIGSY